MMDTDMRRPTESDIVLAKSKLSAGHGLEQVLGFLRSEGFGQVASTIIIFKASGIPMSVAKHKVFTSATWSDKKNEWSTSIDSAIATFSGMEDERTAED